MPMNPNSGNRTTDVPELKIVAWEVTRRCYLKCKHCRASAEDVDYAGELTTAECKRLIDVITARAKPLVILTGGEPMSREDIFEIAAYGRDRGLRMAMSPCGWLLDDRAAVRLRTSGIQKISISLDGHDASSHDAFRGREGAFEKTLAGLEAARRNGIAFQINTTITAHNVRKIDAIYDLAVALGADLFNPFMLVPSGRGRDLANESVSAEEYEGVLEWIFRKQQEGPIPVRPTCAPHFQRVKRQLGKAARKGGASPPAGHAARNPGHGGPGMNLGGCLGGRHFLFISHTGQLQICGFLDLSCGRLREVDLDLWKIWESARVFGDVRDPSQYRGKCGACEFLHVCRGCRARAYATSGDYMDEEPFCSHVPKSTGRKTRRKDGAFNRVG
ncbi:MAG: radical SAM protein [Planctomycetota bacterium]